MLGLAQPNRGARAYAVLCCAAILSFVLPSGAQAAKRDYGDAPDGRSAGYETAPDVKGRFASLKRSRGPSHPQGGGGLLLGTGSSVESNSRQPGRDTNDDGADLEQLDPCSRKSTLLVLIDGRRLSKSVRAKKSNRIYVNAWLDWNRDGDFFDGTDGCAPEWGVQNASIALSKLGADGTALVPIRLRAGRGTSELWWRVTLTLGEKVKDPAGRRARPYRFGETEDFHRFDGPAARAGRVAVQSASGLSERGWGSTGSVRGRASAGQATPGTDCVRSPFIMEHGTERFIELRHRNLDDLNPRPLFDVPEWIAPPLVDTRFPTITRSGRTLLTAQVHQIRVISGRRHPPGDVLRGDTSFPIERIPISVRMRASIRQGKQVIRHTWLLNCLVLIQHGGVVPPVAAPQRQRDGTQTDEKPPPPPACSDDRDNDSDFLSDLRDPECIDVFDQNEAAQCFNRFDDDGDGAIDVRDAGCEGPHDDSEFPVGGARPKTECSDGVDNDDDEKTDFYRTGFPAFFQDPDCTSPDDTSEDSEGPDEDVGGGDGGGSGGDGSGGGGDATPPATLTCPDPPDRFKTSRFPSDGRIGNGGLDECDDDIDSISLEVLGTGTITDAQHHSHRVSDGTCSIGPGTESGQVGRANAKATCVGKLRIIDMSVATNTPCAAFALIVKGKRGGTKTYNIAENQAQNFFGGTCP